MILPTTHKLELLASHAAIIAVYSRIDDGKPTLHALLQAEPAAPNPDVPTHHRTHPITYHYSPPIRPLPLPIPHIPRYPPTPLTAQNQACHNEPIPGGVQIQPAAQPWVGTLGSVCGWQAANGNLMWGALSNWHVMAPTANPADHPQHQPLDTYPAIAHLHAWQAPDPNGVNTIDLALADAKIDGLHSVGPLLWGLGQINPNWTNPQQDMEVAKSGRTTGVTNGRCTATDAVVKVDYGQFVATFAGQAIFESATANFSAPGDSGSLIVAYPDLRPAALLFAGGGNITVGSPIRYAVELFDVTFPQI